MVTSPTGRGVIISGGHLGNENFSNQLIELSGDSIEKLEWTVLDLKLEKARYAHSSFYIPNETYLALNK